LRREGCDRDNCGRDHDMISEAARMVVWESIANVLVASGSVKVLTKRTADQPLADSLVVVDDIHH